MLLTTTSQADGVHCAIVQVLRTSRKEETMLSYTQVALPRLELCWLDQYIKFMIGSTHETLFTWKYSDGASHDVSSN